jgi:hypothetical protein
MPYDWLSAFLTSKRRLVLLFRLAHRWIQITQQIKGT